MATDSHGHITELPNVWFGDIDVAGPRLSFTYDALGAENVQSRCVAEDLNLTDANWVCPVTGLTEITEDADWVVENFGPVTRTGRIETTIQTLNTNADGTMTACDVHGNCSTLTVSPTAAAESSAIVAPANGAIFTTLDPITINGVARSDSGVASLVVTANGETIYTTSWDGSTTEETWTTNWSPPEGVTTFLLEATVTNAAGDSFNDPAETIITIQAPSLHFEKSVSRTDGLAPGELVTYTISLANNGTAEIQNVVVSDILPEGVSGDDLNETVNIAAGQSHLFTIPVTGYGRRRLRSHQYSNLQPYLAKWGITGCDPHLLARPRRAKWQSEWARLFAPSTC